MGYAQMHGNSKGSEATPDIYDVLNKRERGKGISLQK